MGFSEKAQVEGGVESDTNSNNNNRKWVIAGIALRAPLKPLYVVEKEQKVDHDHEQGVETAEECSSTSTTPTSAESKIPTPFTCPPPPRKRKPSSKCKFHVREFFNPPDLESVFIRHVEKAL